MKTLIVYSSLTGNTKMVAEAMFAAAPAGAEIYSVGDAPAAEGYDLVAVGFWVDRGSADKNAAKYLLALRNQKVALFGTLGAYPDSDHARDCMARAAMLLDSGNTLAGTFICQGKIAAKLRESFKNLPPDHPHAMTPERIARHEEAGKHPNEEDLAKAQEFFHKVLKAQ